MKNAIVTAAIVTIGCIAALLAIPAAKRAYDRKCEETAIARYEAEQAKIMELAKSGRCVELTVGIDHETGKKIAVKRSGMSKNYFENTFGVHPLTDRVRVGFNVYNVVRV